MMLKKIIKTLQKNGWKVTVHDMGKDDVEFVLAVQLKEPDDLWYLALCFIEHELSLTACYLDKFEPSGKKKLWVAYFPAYKIGAAEYDWILG